MNLKVTCESPRYTDTVSDTYSTRPSFDSTSRKPSSDCINNETFLFTYRLTYLLRYLVAGQSQVVRRRANRGNGVWRRNCVQICLGGATHKLLSVAGQLVGGQQTHVAIEPHRRQSNRFSVVSRFDATEFHFCNMSAYISPNVCNVDNRPVKTLHYCKKALELIQCEF